MLEFGLFKTLTWDYRGVDFKSLQDLTLVVWVEEKMIVSFKSKDDVPLSVVHFKLVYSWFRVIFPARILDQVGSHKDLLWVGMHDSDLGVLGIVEEELFHFLLEDLESFV